MQQKSASSDSIMFANSTLAEKVPNRLTTSTGLASDNHAGKKCVPYSTGPYESLQISLNTLIVITEPPGHNRHSIASSSGGRFRQHQVFQPDHNTPQPTHIN